MGDDFKIEAGRRYRYRTPPRDQVTVTGVDGYSVRYVGKSVRAEMDLPTFRDMFEPNTED